MATLLHITNYYLLSTSFGKLVRRSSPILQVPTCRNKARRVNAVPLLCLHIHKNSSNIAQREQQESEGQMLLSGKFTFEPLQYSDDDTVVRVVQLFSDS